MAAVVGARLAAGRPAVRRVVEPLADGLCAAAIACTVDTLWFGRATVSSFLWIGAGVLAAVGVSAWWRQRRARERP